MVVVLWLVALAKVPVKRTAVDPDVAAATASLLKA
jgi:hypothetical protein